MEKSHWAPVLIPTLNRYEHLHRCLESLKKCTYSEKTDVYIALDYPARKEHFEGYYKVKEILNKIKKTHNFNQFIIIEREYNFGFGEKGNLITLINQVKKSYDYYIVSEDDNVFAPAFLDYINNALSRFYYNNKITSISGFLLSSQYNNKYHLLKTIDNSAWGSAYWVYKNKTIQKYLNREYALKVLLSISKSLKIYITYPALLEMLILMLQKKNIWGDTLRTTYNILNGTYQLRPSISLVKNCGHDGSGINCQIDNSDLFINQILYTEKKYTITNNEKVIKIKWIKLFLMGLPHNFKIIRRLISIIRRYIIFRIKYFKGIRIK